MDEELGSWAAVNKALQTANEKRCKELLDHEKTNGKRPHFLLRIYGRYNKLRAERERRELTK